MEMANPHSLGPGLWSSEPTVLVQRPPSIQAPFPPWGTMLRRRRRRSSSTSACVLSLFVMVILLVLPAGVAAASKKQSLLNWLKRTFQGGEEDLGADKAFASGAVAAANLFPAITDGTNQPPPPVVGPSPPLLDQIRELFATLGLPLSSLAHINDLNANDIILVRSIISHAFYMHKCRNDSLGLTRPCPSHSDTQSLSAVMPAKIVHLQVGRVIVVDEVSSNDRSYHFQALGSCLGTSTHSNQKIHLGNHAGTHKCSRQQMSKWRAVHNKWQSDSVCDGQPGRIVPIQCTD